MNGPERYTYDTLREKINDALYNKEMPQRLYKSTDAIFRIIDTIVKTKGEGWATQVVNNQGNPLFTQNEQLKFTDAFKPYIDTIVDYFDNDKDSISGGVYTPDISKISDMSKGFIKSKLKQTTGAEDDNPAEMVSIDNIYAKAINKIGNIDSTVNHYASKYGILRLEKEHDLEPDPRIIPQPAALAISEGVLALSTAAGFPIPPTITLEILSKIKIPFRTIIFVVYLALDVTRIVMGVAGPASSRKLLSIVLAILELLRGDWKKAVLTFIGFYGMTPLLAGEAIKVFLTLFRQLSPQLQQDIIFGSLDVTKSFIIGVLLSIFQVTAPEEVRLPLIGILEKIAETKARIDGDLVGEGLSARPDYLSPTFEDLNNIQAVMSDEAYICSCEFEKLIDAVNKSAIISIILQILRIPVTKEFKELKCGKGPCKDFVHTVVAESIEDKKKEEEVEGPMKIDLPVDLDPDNPITAPPGETATQKAAEISAETSVNNKQNNTNEEASVEETNNKNQEKEVTVSEDTSKKNTEKEETISEETNKKNTEKEEPEVKTKGGRILHSRKNKMSFIA